MEVKTSGAAMPEKLNLYEISFAQNTVLLLRNHQKATINDFAVGDKINVYGHFENGIFQTVIARNLSKPEEKEFIQLNNLVVIEKSGNLIKAARKKIPLLFLRRNRCWREKRRGLSGAFAASFR